MDRENAWMIVYKALHSSEVFTQKYDFVFYSVFVFLSAAFCALTELARDALGTLK